MIRAARWPGLLLVLAMTAGCTLGPDHEPPQMALPAEWSGSIATSATAVQQGAWWQRFGDSELDGLIAEALQANPDVAKARATLRAARAGLAQEQAGLWPGVDASASVTRQHGSSGGGTEAAGSGGGAGTSTAWKADFDASFELDVFGGQRRAIESSRASAEASEADLDSTVLSLIGDVADAYVQARGYQARLAVAQKTLATRRDTAALTRDRARAGLATELDAVQAYAEVADAEAAIPPLEQSYRQQVHSLGILTGAPPGDLLGLMQRPEAIPSLAGQVVADAPATLLARRPDIRAAERRLAAATAAIGAAEADRYPAISFAGMVGINASSLRDLGEVSSRVWSIAPEVSLPVFDAGWRAAVVDQRVAERDEAVAAWRSTVLTALKEVEDALTGLDRERAHNDLLRRSVAAYADAARLARTQYTAGLSDFLDVLDSERSLADAQDTLTQSDATLAIQAIALFKALGGGWEVASS
ncbi:MAG TPA: efflux transporter outer membrane subunit [Geminicoccaceae bacterium]|nr:efflux transporter outer membrane subunit [Geminicoccus sp.]HMU52001.1 efflux transporter outer membrane subunit [Geminicoccaceae bacterium]